MPVSVLFDRRGSHIELDAEPADCQTVASVEQLAPALREGQERLHRVPIDDIIGLFDAAGRSWVEPGHPVGRVFRDRKLGFLAHWLRRRNLERLCDVALHGNRQALDRFVPALAGSPRLHRAHPRGILVHWVAGNVPLLGMISVVQGLLTKNANLVKASRHNVGVLPFLLDALRRVCFTGSGGVMDGSMLTDAVTVTYANREDAESARALSLLADVRVAWGGREAVETIVNLPRRLGAEDIVFGPKTSFAVVGADTLADEDTARQTAQRLARDTVALDQRGCNSPHTVFVERGGVVTPLSFAGVLARELLLLANRLPPPTITVPEAFEILTRRAVYEVRGDAWYGDGVTWSVLYAEEEGCLAAPCYGRTLFVRPVDDVFDIVPLCSTSTQSAGLALTTRRLALADALTARGVERCPELGSMALYDTPWDGMYPIDRMVRWVSA